ncbi:hypothetical protein H8E07_20580 [bacterium]|nr:hypothetical protein [bacterium]
MITFVIGVPAGLLIAWWREGLGGLIVVASILLFHVIWIVNRGEFEFILMIEAIAAQGVLFLACWMLSRRGGDNQHVAVSRVEWTDRDIVADRPARPGRQGLT